MIKISKFPSIYESGAKRANIVHADVFYCENVPAYQTVDWFVAHGKTEDCQFEGTWWDMICFARNILANENTKLVAPEFYKPELKNDNYTGPKPYEFEQVPEDKVKEK